MKILAKYVLSLIIFVLFYLFVISRLDTNHSNILALWFWLFVTQIGYSLGMALFDLVINEGSKPIRIFIRDNKHDTLVILFGGLLSSFVMSIQIKSDVSVILILVCAIMIWGLMILMFGSKDLKTYFFNFRR